MLDPMCQWVDIVAIPRCDLPDRPQWSVFFRVNVSYTSLMLKTQTLTLAGRDAGRSQTITELPALVVDRLARAALKSIDADPDGGIVALALKYLPDIRKLGPPGLEILQQFVQTDGPPPRDWRNVEKLQQAALLLHVGFIVEREALQVPVAMQAENILEGLPDVRVTFCSPHIAAVLESGKATYRELETVLGTEDVFNIVEILNVRAIHDWHAHKQNEQP